MPNNLSNVRLSELPEALAAASDAEVTEFYLHVNGVTMAAGTFHSDPFRALAKAEEFKRDQVRFDALEPWEKSPGAYRN